MNIAAIMPCRGRAAQTVANVRRLLAAAGYSDWRLICVGGTDEQDILLACSAAGAVVRHYLDVARLSYWQALARETAMQRDATHLIGLANDLLPGQHWLRRAVVAYQQQFGGGPGLLGFNGDSHEVGHACHFLIDRRLLVDYGGWPIWYDHNYGDTELCQRAIGDGLYAKALWAVLYHDHPYWGGQDDTVYAEGRAQVDRDAWLYEQRKKAGWSHVMDR